MNTFAHACMTIDADTNTIELARRLNIATEALWMHYAIAMDEKLLDEVELEMEKEFIESLEKLPDFNPDECDRLGHKLDPLKSVPGRLMVCLRCGSASVGSRNGELK